MFNLKLQEIAGTAGLGAATGSLLGFFLGWALVWRLDIACGWAIVGGGGGAVLGPFMSRTPRGGERLGCATVTAAGVLGFAVASLLTTFLTVEMGRRTGMLRGYGPLYFLPLLLLAALLWVAIGIWIGARAGFRSAFLTGALPGVVFTTACIVWVYLDLPSIHASFSFWSCLILFAWAALPGGVAAGVASLGRERR